jgi:hypothetical protein
MRLFDFYTNPRKPTLGLYVRKGEGLPDLADASQWALTGTLSENQVSASIAKEIDEIGHAFQELAEP